MSSNGRNSRASGRLWALVLALTVAIVAAFGSATPAWAAGEQTASDLQTLQGYLPGSTITSGEPEGKTGTITLEGPVSLSAYINIPDGTNYTINLGGQEIERQSEGATVFQVLKGASLTLTGSGSIKNNASQENATGPMLSAAGGSIDIDGNLDILANSGTLVISNSGTATLRNGTLGTTGNITTVNPQGGGTFNMYGGVVNGTTASPGNGNANAAVLIGSSGGSGGSSSGTLNMSGGKIVGTQGPAVYVNLGGATIAAGDAVVSASNGNTAVTVGGSSSTSDDTTFTMNGGRLECSGTKTVNGKQVGGNGITAYAGTTRLMGGTVVGGEHGVDALSLDGTTSATVIIGGSASVSGRFGVGVACGANLTVQDDAVITGEDIGIGSNGSASVSPTIGGTSSISNTASKITVTGGTVTGGTAGMYLPAPPDKPNQVVVTGGTVSGDAGVVNAGSTVAVSGDAVVKAEAAPGTPLEVGDSGVEYPAAGIVAAEPSSSYGDTKTFVAGGKVEGGIVNGLPTGTEGVTGENAPGLTVTTGDATIGEDGEVVVTPSSTATAPTIDGGTTNNGKGTAELLSGTFGDVTNNAEPNEDGTPSMTIGKEGTPGPEIGGTLSAGEGSSVDLESGDVAEVGEGVEDDRPVEDVPGAPDTITNGVIGVKGEVIKNASAYATVSVSANGQAWTIEVTDEDVPLATAAQGIVAPVLTAVQASGAASATSLGDPQHQIELAGATPQQVLAFATSVLQEAVPSTALLDLGSDATLADLEGMTAGFTAETTTTPMTFTFAFSGEQPPTPPTQQVVAVYRLYNPYDELHMYTTDADEISALEAQGWRVDFDGEPCWVAPAPGSDLAAYEVVRLYNPNSGDHYFVPASDAAQLDLLEGLGWQRESAKASIWSADPTASDVEVSTLFNPWAQRDTHLYTASEAEVEALVRPGGWEPNAPVFWGVPDPLTVG